MNFIYIKRLLTMFIYCCLYACEGYLEVDVPFDQLSHSEVFKDEATATAAITTMYAKLRNEVLLTGGQTGVGFLMGLYTDELDYFGTIGFQLEKFHSHRIIASDNTVNNLWNSAYNLIHMSNSAVEGLESSQSLTVEVKNRLKGEAFFVRALTHFYLVNLFGDIPYIITTNYLENDKVTRMAEAEVYEYIVKDLNNAKILLSDSYVTNERTRPSKWTVSALLARVYLYLEQWENAETESSLVINNTSLYNLHIPLDKVFLRKSPSTIWQLNPKKEGDNTQEATLFYLFSGPPQISALNPTLVQEMEDGDLRRVHWIGEVSNGTTTWYFPYKYKQNQNTGTSLEYSIVFRLAEQYLIRAEARAWQGNIAGSQQDINAVRTRAGLSNITATTTEAMVGAIITERRFELFTEHGHRWFDLKRTGLVNQVLALVKPGWTSTDVLLPIPEAELLMNPKLSPQNQGY